MTTEGETTAARVELTGVHPGDYTIYLTLLSVPIVLICIGALCLRYVVKQLK